MSPILALIIANIIWGAAAPIFKYSLDNIPPFTLAFLRFFLASIVFIPFIYRFNFRKLTPKDWYDILVGAFFGITVNITFFFLGLQKSESINAPVIASSGPVFLFLLSVLFLHEKIRYRVLIGMLIALCGVLTIILAPLFFDGSTARNEVEGNFLYILATLGSVIAPLMWKKVVQKHGAYVVTFISFVFSSITFAPLMLPEFQVWSFAQLNLAGLIGILFGAFLSSAAAYYLYNYGIGKILTQEIGIFTYIDPIVAVVIAAPLLHEYPTPQFFAGAMLVFLGIYISEKRLQYHPFSKIKRHNLIQ